MARPVSSTTLSAVPAAAPGLAAASPTGSAARMPTLLIVADTAERAAVIEAGLGPTWHIESAIGIDAGLELLAHTLIDAVLVISAGNLDGLAFRQRLDEERRWRDIPFVLVANDAAPATRAAAWAKGVDTCLPPDSDPTELHACLTALMRRRRRLQAGLRERSYVLAGDFTGLPFADLVMRLEQNRQSGLLVVHSTYTSARLRFANGRLTHVTCGNVHGPEGFYAAMRLERAHFEFGPAEPETAEPDIEESCTALLMEGSRLQDTYAAADEPVTVTVRRHTSQHPALVPPAPAPNNAWAQSLLDALNDPFLLGELHYLDAAAAQAWISSQDQGERLHVLLAAETATGVAALQSLAAPLVETEVVAGLAAVPKTLALDFDLPGARRMDVVLIDVHAPAAALGVLRRQPGLVLICPPRGDPLALGPQDRADWRRALRRLSPRSVLGLGQPSLANLIPELLTGAGIDTCIWRCQTGALEDPDTDARDLLQKGVRLWAGNKETSSGPPVGGTTGTFSTRQ
jgi:CheY-like chemotaxis protein